MCKVPEVGSSLVVLEKNKKKEKPVGGQGGGREGRGGEVVMRGQ